MSTNNLIRITKSTMSRRSPALEKRCEELDRRVDSLESMNVFLIQLLEKARSENEDLRQELRRVNGKIKRIVSLKNCRRDIQREKDCALVILPEVVLGDVLSNLTDPRDLASCSRASTVCLRLLESKKSLWLFHEVLPSVSRYLVRKDILKCRLACRVWKQSVDRMVEKPPMQYQNFSINCVTNFNEYPGPRPLPQANWSRFYIRFFNSVDIERFLETMGTHPGNPFVGRRISLIEDEDETYWTNALKLLKRFGGEVRECCISTFHASIPVMYIIKGCISQLPNLEKLFINNRNFLHPISTERRLDNFVRSLSLHPYPQLPHLESVELCQVPNIFFDFVFPIYANQLQSLELCDATDSDLFYDDNLPNLFPNLKRLRFLVRTNTELIRLLRLKCGLEKIWMVFGFSTIDYGNLFMVLQHFSKTLISLRISFPSSGGTDNSHFTNATPFECIKLNLPSLETVELINPSGSLNFLACLSRVLKFVRIQWCFTDIRHGNPLFIERENEPVMIHGYVDRMYESNIWKLIPTLQEFQVYGYYNHDDVSSNIIIRYRFNHNYTRRHYECFVLDLEKQGQDYKPGTHRH